MKKPVTVSDLSAVVTGILLAYCLPVTAPLWLRSSGRLCDHHSQAAVRRHREKLHDPALAARAFLFSWPVIMTTWVKPHTALPLFETPVDVITAATPLADLHRTNCRRAYRSFRWPSAKSAEALERYPPLRCSPAACIAVPQGDQLQDSRRVHRRRRAADLSFPPRKRPAPVHGGQRIVRGLMLGAIFMATDYTTSPVTKNGQWIFGLGCGL